MCLFDSKAVNQVLTGENGLLSVNVKDKTIIDLSTNHHKDVLEFHALTSKKRISYLETPVFGSVSPAIQGAVIIVCLGEKEVFTNYKTLLEKIGKEIFHLPQPSNASKMKLINNLCLGSFMSTLAECTALGEACDIEKSKLLEILGVGGGQTLIIKSKTQKLIEEDFYSIYQMFK